MEGIVGLTTYYLVRVVCSANSPGGAALLGKGKLLSVTFFMGRSGGAPRSNEVLIFVGPKRHKTMLGRHQTSLY